MALAFVFILCYSIFCGICLWCVRFSF